MEREDGQGGDHVEVDAVLAPFAVLEATGKTGKEEENDARLEGEEGEVILESAVETDQVATLEHAQKADEAEWVKGERSLCEGYRCGRLAA